MTVITKRYHKNGTATVRYDFTPHCKRCFKKPRGKLQISQWEEYQPFCSFHCQEAYKLEEAEKYLASRRPHDRS